MKTEKTTLVQVSTSDGIVLDGNYVSSLSKKIAVLHIHGFAGNFYQNSFIDALKNELEEKGVGFLTVNTRGSGKETDFNTIRGDNKKIGARYELLEEAHIDITAWIQFLINEGYVQIVLQGYSQGTMKVVRYLFEGELKDKVNKLILLSPLDIRGQMAARGKNNIEDLLKKAQKKIDEGKGTELTTPDFDYEGDVFSYNTFRSLYSPDDFGRVFDYSTQDYDFPILQQINIPTKIIIGSEDEYFQSKNPEEVIKMLPKTIPHANGKIINGATHSFMNYEKVLAKEVISFC